MSKTALIAGATGLVGHELLDILLKSDKYEKVHAIVRRPLEVEHPKLVEMIIDFDRLHDLEYSFDVDDVYCCLGTTIKKAKTKEAMYKIDVEYALALAYFGRRSGANHFLLISSMNANANSFFWYPKMKGQLENEIKKVPYETISIFQPSLLLGERKEYRFAENVGAKIARGLSIINGNKPISRFAIEAKAVALAMYNVAQSDKRGIRTISASEMQRIITEGV